MINFEVASYSNFRNNRDAEVRASAGGTNAICSRPETANDVISGYNVETFPDYHAANL